MIKIRSGIGYDIHRLIPGDGLMIGGVKISKAMKADAHSDGDVLIHSLIDALLGAMGGQDIGELFPDTDPAFKGVAGETLLRRVKEMLDGNDFAIINVDSVIVIESPKIAPFKDEIRNNMAGILEIGKNDFNVKAKSKEKTGAIGRGEAVECFSIAVICNKAQGRAG